MTLLVALFSLAPLEAPAAKPSAQELVKQHAPSRGNSPYLLLEASGPYDIVIAAAGDVAHPGPNFPGYVNKKGKQLFAKIRKLLKRAHLVHCNLEGPLTELEPTAKKLYPQTIPPERMKWLLWAGFNLVTIANNHIGDAGFQGISETIDALDALEAKKKILAWAGASKDDKNPFETKIFTVPDKKLKVAFIAVGIGKSKYVPKPWDTRVLTEIKKAHKKAHLVIVSAHWGSEYAHVPTAKEAAQLRKYIDAGADLVLGHHSHVVAGVERYKKGVIFHGLGNFSFATKTLRHLKKGAVMYGMLPLIQVTKKKITAIEIVPLYVDNSAPVWAMGKSKMKIDPFVPSPLEDPFATKVLEQIQAWSDKIPGKKSSVSIEIVDGRGFIIL